MLRDINKRARESIDSLALRVGITGLEPATSRPPDVCATNCAKSRFAGAKVRSFFEIRKFSKYFLLKRYIINVISLAIYQIIRTFVTL